MITSSASTVPSFFPMNVGHATVAGGSLELVGRLGDLWLARVNFTTQIARDAATGQDLVYRPRQQASIELSRQWAPGDVVTVVVSYVGYRFDDRDNTMRVPGYWLIGLNTTWALGDGFALQAGVNNLFDAQYQESLGFPEPGRTAYVGLSKTF